MKNAPVIDDEDEEEEEVWTTLKNNMTHVNRGGVGVTIDMV